MADSQPLLATRGVAGQGAWEAQGGGRGRVRVVAGTVGCIAVLALLGMETRGLMHFGKSLCRLRGLRLQLCACVW
jgi:hypothetical protein